MNIKLTLHDGDQQDLKQAIKAASNFFKTIILAFRLAHKKRTNMSFILMSLEGNYIMDIVQVRAYFDAYTVPNRLLQAQVLIRGHLHLK